MVLLMIKTVWCNNAASVSYLAIWLANVQCHVVVTVAIMGMSVMTAGASHHVKRWWRTRASCRLLLALSCLARSQNLML